MKTVEPSDLFLTWKYIVDLFRKENAKNIAFVWCCCTAFSKKIQDIMEFYPGNEYVDWFGNDLFGSRHFANNQSKVTEDLAEESERHKKPLMIAESSAARVGVELGQESWDNWFRPYFEWIKNHKSVKAFCYINWNWAIDWKQSEWGNCRIEENNIISQNYAQEMENPKYLHNVAIKEFLEKTYGGNIET